MNLTNLVTSYIGVFHLIFSVLSLIYGSMVLLNKKGTKHHKKYAAWQKFDKSNNS